MPAGGASSVPPVNTDPSMDDPNAAPMPSMDDPNAMGPTMDEPSDMASDAVNGEMGESNGDDSTIGIINQLSDEDKEAVRSYAQSMLNKDNNGQDTNSNDNADPNNAPMMEGVVFTKAQIKKLNENFGPTEDELNQKNDRKPLGKKNGKKSISKKSPFNTPNFK